MMSGRALALPRKIVWLRPTILQRSGIIAFLVLLVIVAILITISPNHLSYFDLSTISASATTLALAGIGETIVVLAGGLDLSPGAVISLVNVVLVTQLGQADFGVGTYTILAAAIAIGIGTVIGAINGVLVSYLRLLSIIVTLATHVRPPGRRASYPEISRRDCLGTISPIYWLATLSPMCCRYLF